MVRDNNKSSTSGTSWQASVRRRGGRHPRTRRNAECGARHSMEVQRLAYVDAMATHVIPTLVAPCRGRAQRGRFRLRPAPASRGRRDGSGQTASPFAAPSTGVPPVTPPSATGTKWTAPARPQAALPVGHELPVERRWWCREARSVTRGPRLLPRRAAWRATRAWDNRGGLDTDLPLQPSLRAHLIRGEHSTRPWGCKACASATGRRPSRKGGTTCCWHGLNAAPQTGFPQRLSRP